MTDLLSDSSEGLRLPCKEHGSYVEHGLFPTLVGNSGNCPGGYKPTTEEWWICEVHNAESTNQLDPPEDQSACWLYMDFPEKPDGPCRMVKRLLVSVEGEK